MPAKKTLPYGTWPSPVTPALVARGSKRFGTLQSASGAVYWTESRPEEGGRQVILRAAAKGGQVEELLPAPFSARSRVHEYGGGEFLVAGGVIYFVNDRDQQVYAIEKGAAAAPDHQCAPHALCRFCPRSGARPPDRRGRGAPRQGRCRPPRAARQPARRALHLAGTREEIATLAEGRDFYASPRLSPDGRRLAYLAWDLPDMPWDSASSPRGRRSATAANSAGPSDWRAATAAPSSSRNGTPDGRLYFVWDKTGWGQLYRWDGKRIARVHGRRGVELMRPQWVFGSRSYALRLDGRAGLASLVRGAPQFEVLDLKGGTATRYDALSSRTARIDDPVPNGNGFAAQVTRPTAPQGVMRIARGSLQPVAGAAAG